MILRVPQEENMKVQLNRAAIWMTFAVVMSLMMVDQAFAGFVSYTPPPPTPEPVPEIDGPAGIAAIALLSSVAAVMFGKSKNKC
jgi:hypothetical protein